MNQTVFCADSATVLGIGEALVVKMLQTLLVLRIGDARTEPRDEAGPTIATAAAETIAPLSTVLSDGQVLYVPIPSRSDNHARGSHGLLEDRLLGHVW